jgi:hypothetical protein
VVGDDEYEWRRRCAFRKDSWRVVWVHCRDANQSRCRRVAAVPTSSGQRLRILVINPIAPVGRSSAAEWISRSDCTLVATRRRGAQTRFISWRSAVRPVRTISWASRHRKRFL